jgi:opacity protein-like surface antigen
MQWTYVSGFSPFGTRINLRPHKRLQPTASLTAGLLMSAKRIPISSAGSFNFTFEIGAGVEYYLQAKRSVRLEWMYQHFSKSLHRDRKSRGGQRSHQAHIRLRTLVSVLLRSLWAQRINGRD